LEISVWKRLWTCRETDKYLNLNWNEQPRSSASRGEMNCMINFW
jgi:hypothetical protein